MVVAGPRNHFDRTDIGRRQSRSNWGGFSAFGAVRQIHHGGDVADQLDHRLGPGGHLDPLDQGADELEGLGLEPGIGKCGLQIRDALAIDLSQFGVHADDGDLSIGQHLLQVSLPGFKPVEAGQ